jgi:hypothetical protein
LLSFSKWLLRFSGFRHEQKSLWCEPSQTMRSRGNVAQSMGTGTSSGGDPEESHTWDWIDEKHHLDENQSGEKLWVVLAAVYFCELSSVSSVGGVGLRAVILLLSPLYKVCGISIIFPLKIVKSPWRGMPRVPFGRPSVGVRRHFPLELLLWAVAFPAARELYHSWWKGSAGEFLLRLVSASDAVSLILVNWLNFCEIWTMDHGQVNVFLFGAFSSNNHLGLVGWCKMM